MKRVLFSLFLMLNLISFTTQAQNQTQTLAIISIASKGVLMDAEQCANLTTLELQKIKMYDVYLRDDIRASLRKRGVSLDTCLGRDAAIAAGKLLNVNYVLTGRIERFGEKIVVAYYLYNVSLSKMEISQVDEYLNMQPELQTMIRLSLLTLFDKPYNKTEYERLTKETALDNQSNNPGITKLSLSGPRVGMLYINNLKGSDGQYSRIWRRLIDNEAQGGYEWDENFPITTVFGYQQEFQYLNQGAFQALFEILPLVSGLEKGRFVPAIVFMNGFRDNVKGWEIAFGPSFGINQTSRGYYYDEGPNPDHKYHTEGEWQEKDANNNPLPNNNPVKTYLDKRGALNIDYAFVIAVGKTFRSGSLNIPVNAFSTMSKDDYRFGLSFGFNAKGNK